MFKIIEKIRSINRFAFLTNVFNLAVIEMISIKAISASVFSPDALSLNHKQTFILNHLQFAMHLQFQINRKTEKLK